jgi:hypothetical protein
MVYGLWVDAAPYRVSSGYITKDTKVKFIVHHVEVNFLFYIRSYFVLSVLVVQYFYKCQKKCGISIIMVIHIMKKQ